VQNFTLHRKWFQLILDHNADRLDVAYFFFKSSFLYNFYFSQSTDFFQNNKCLFMPVISIESTVRLRYQEASIRAMNKTSRHMRGMILAFTRGNTSAMEDTSRKKKNIKSFVDIHRERNFM